MLDLFPNRKRLKQLEESNRHLTDHLKMLKALIKDQEAQLEAYAVFVTERGLSPDEATGRNARQVALQMKVDFVDEAIKFAVRDTRWIMAEPEEILACIRRFVSETEAEFYQSLD